MMGIKFNNLQDNHFRKIKRKNTSFRTSEQYLSNQRENVNECTHLKRI